MNTENLTRVFMNYYYVVNSTYTNGTVDWKIYNTLNTQWSIKTFFIDLDAYLDSGFFGIDDFGRKLLIFLIMFISIGAVVYKFGVNSPSFLTGLAFFIVFFLDVGVGIVPEITMLGGNEIPFILTFVTGLIFTITILNEVYRS